MGELNKQFRILIHLVCEAVPSFRHFDPNKIAISVSPSRTSGRHGLWAYVVPLRYVGGGEKRKTTFRGFLGAYHYESPDIEKHCPGALYLMSFVVPKFFRHSTRERAETIVHELYHIHPEFRGDLRRFPAPHRHHGPTPKEFHRQVKRLTDELYQNAPELLQHPLLRMNENEGRKMEGRRLRLPQRSFVPDKSIFTSLQKMFFLLALMLSPSLKAALEVYIVDSTNLYEKPSARSSTLGSVRKDSLYKAYKKSLDQQWVFIVNGNKKGWVKRNYIRPAYAAPFTPKAENDEDFSGEQKKKRKIETTFFQESVAYSRMEGELYESPSEDAERFGRIEKGDELQIIKRTVEGKWFNIRIQLTGEEGWVPEEMIRFEDYDNVGVSPRVAFEVQGAFLTKNIGLGGGAMGAFNLWPHGAGDKIRDRLELGITYNFHANTYQTTTGVEIKRTTHVLPLELRYMPSASLGRFFAIVSGGPLLYFNQYTSIASEAQLKASSAIDDSFVFALSLGAGAGFCVNENFYFSYHVRLILRTALVVGQTFGIGGRF